MPRYAAFLRAVSPMNAKMANLRKAFEAAGFSEVKTVLSSGNVVFDAKRASEASLQRTAEAVAMLREMLAADPYRAFRLDPSAKRIENDALSS
jgi:uncharacterized protein (DUF1697 family)